MAGLHCPQHQELDVRGRSRAGIPVGGFLVMAALWALWLGGKKCPRNSAFCSCHISSAHSTSLSILRNIRSRKGSSLGPSPRTPPPRTPSLAEALP